MMFRDEPAEASALLYEEMRRFARLRWLAGLALLLGSWLGREIWPHAAASGMIVGGSVLAYNGFIVTVQRVLDPARLRRADGDGPRNLLRWLAWFQIILDIVCLAIVTVSTDGRCGPAAGLFVLHMVLSSILLSAIESYLVALLSVVAVAIALHWTGQWPAAVSDAILWGSWALVLFATCFLTGRITNGARRHHMALRERHEQLRAILDTAIDGIIAIDAKGTILSANAAADRIFGYTKGDLVGRRVNELMPEPDRSQHDGYIRNYQETRKPKIIGIGREVVGQRRDGSLVPLDLSVSEVRIGTTLWFTGIVRDISERKRAEDELRTVNASLVRHQHALIQNEKMVAMGQMAAGIVHEIGNPLASMDTLLQLVQRHPERLDHAKAVETATALREQVTRIHHIVRQLTDFAHPSEQAESAGEAAWELRTPQQLVESTLEVMRFDRRLRGVTVERRFTPAQGEVRVIPQLFQQVLVNMIVNAVDAMSGVEKPRLVLSTARCGGSWVISIEDNGHGIEAEHLARVFEPFFTTKPIGKGTGLGLSISYSVIQRHGGVCEIESEVGRGTTFKILLPAHAAGG